VTPVLGHDVSASVPIQYPFPQHCLVDAVLAQFPSITTLEEAAAAALVVDEMAAVLVVDETAALEFPDKETTGTESLFADEPTRDDPGCEKPGCEDLVLCDDEMPCSRARKPSINEAKLKGAAKASWTQPATAPIRTRDLIPMLPITSD